ncbi:MAG: hypothetical protein HFI68_03500 [Lachnospiraceae bacterium]|nr:hypothetical protein [Lachnospiraceae bacterium]
MELLQEISEFLQKGRAKNVKQLVQQALDEGLDPKTILNTGLLDGMSVIGGKFKRNEVFVPEVLVAARALNAGLSILEPKLIEIGNEPVGRVVIGTVKGDLHDIGKNLVAMMLKGAGFEVFDVGVDVPAEAFIEKAEAEGADIICMSALLTTTMEYMQEVIAKLNQEDLRKKYIVMDIIHLRLERLVTVQPDFNQIRENLMAVPTGMLQYKFSFILHTLMKPGHLRLYVMPPVLRPHNQPSLLPPVITEINSVNVVLQGNIHKMYKIIADTGKQPFRLLRIGNHTAEDFFHSHQGPGALKHTKPKAGKSKTSASRRNKLFIFFSQALFIANRENIIIVFNIFNEAVIHHTDIFIRTVTVPDNTELIFKITGASRNLLRPTPILDIVEITSNLLFNIGIPGVVDQLIQRLFGKFYVIRQRMMIVVG